MKFILVIFLSCLLLGCVTIRENTYNKNHKLEKELVNKNIGEILNILEDGDAGYIAEPPCSLSRIFILSKNKLVTVDLEINHIPIELRENTINCKWQIKDFYPYYPSAIKVKKIDQTYIEKFYRPFNK